jgi:hypothetical protein
MADATDGDVREMKHAEGITSDGGRAVLMSVSQGQEVLVMVILEEGPPIEITFDRANGTNLRDQLNTILGRPGPSIPRES